MEAGAHSTRGATLELTQNSATVFEHWPPGTHYDWQIFSNANRLRITSVAPFICISCFFLNSENSRLTVSRVVPMISATSSWVSVSLTCAEPSSCAVLLDQESNSFANFSDGETESPSVRISSYAV